MSRGARGAMLSPMTTIDPGAEIGHVHLQVTDLDRSIRFYRDVLGFNLRAQVGGEVGFLAAGDYHHHIGLNTFSGAAGLYHAAIRYPTRAAFAAAVRSVAAHGHAISHGSDHGVNEAVYLERSRRQRARALLGPPARRVAGGPGQPPARPRRVAQGSLTTSITPPPTTSTRTREGSKAPSHGPSVSVRPSHVTVRRAYGP